MLHDLENHPGGIPTIHQDPPVTGHYSAVLQQPQIRALAGHRAL
jgi:hypothetical protein